MAEKPDRRRRTPIAEYEQAVALYTAAGGEESVQRVVTAISRIQRELDVYYRRQFAELGLSHGEWTVLSSLAQEGTKGSLTPSRLADVAAVSPSTMTHRLDGLARRGLVVRPDDPENRTRVRVSLTNAGWELFRRAVTEADSVESSVLSQLSNAERSELGALLERVVAGLRAL
jgi:DNA-binding MarR family transcriptional regulator